MGTRNLRWEMENNMNDNKKQVQVYGTQYKVNKNKVIEMLPTAWAMLTKEEKTQE